MSNQLVSRTDAVPYQEFARLIGKTPAAVKGMIEKGKLPVVEMTDPQIHMGCLIDPLHENLRKVFRRPGAAGAGNRCRRRGAGTARRDRRRARARARDARAPGGAGAHAHRQYPGRHG